MKRILLLQMLILLSKSVIAQQACDSLLITTQDKFTGDVTISNKNPIVIQSASGSKVLINILYLSKQKTTLISFDVTSSGFGCTDETGKVYFLADDKTNMMVYNNSSFNCNGHTVLYLTALFGNKKVKKYLEEKNITAIRVQSRTDLVDVDVDKETASQIKQIISCLDK